jgi:predicted metal-binding membrane protein
MFASDVVHQTWVAALTMFILVERLGRSGIYVARIGGVAIIAAGIIVVK